MWDLSKEPTKVLLKWLRYSHKMGLGYNPTDDGKNFISKEELKKELATREHIPNKQEAKAQRKYKIKKGK